MREIQQINNCLKVIIDLDFAQGRKIKPNIVQESPLMWKKRASP